MSKKYRYAYGSMPVDVYTEKMHEAFNGWRYPIEMILSDDGRLVSVAFCYSNSSSGSKRRANYRELGYLADKMGLERHERRREDSRLPRDGRSAN